MIPVTEYSVSDLELLQEQIQSELNRRNKTVEHALEIALDMSLPRWKAFFDDEYQFEVQDAITSP